MEASVGVGNEKEAKDRGENVLGFLRPCRCFTRACGFIRFSEPTLMSERL
jgi:hypothetical protein